MRFFNSEGLVVQQRRYCISALERLDFATTDSGPLFFALSAEAAAKFRLPPAESDLVRDGDLP